MEELRPDVGLEGRRALLDQAQAEVDVAEQPSLGGLGERRGRPSSLRPADVVEQRRGAEQVGSETRVELAELAADRRHPDRVLEQAARVDVMPVHRRRELAERLRDRRVSDDRAHGRLQARMGDLAGEEVEEAFELVDVAPDGRRQRGGIVSSAGSIVRTSS